jgi:hypothetical protein
MLQNLVLTTTYLHFFVVMEQIVVLLVDPSQNLASAFLLIIKVETLIPWAISDAPTHLTSLPAWEKWVISDQIYEIWISPSISNFANVVSSTILLLVEDQYCLSLWYPLVFFAFCTKSLFPHHHQTKTLELLF